MTTCSWGQIIDDTDSEEPDVTLPLLYIVLDWTDSEKHT